MLEVGACALIVLAAGRSDRMGTPKGLLRVDGRTLVEYQVARFAAAGGRLPVVVVIGGAAAPAYREALTGRGGLILVESARPDAGAFASVQAGLAAAGCGSVSAAFVLPVDVPAPRPGVWAALASACAAGAAAAYPAAPQGHGGGHPVLVAAAAFPRLLAVDPAASDGRLDAQLRALGAARVPVDDPTVGLNLNTPEAFEAWLRERERCTQDV